MQDKLEFARQMIGPEEPEVRRLHGQFLDALEPPQRFSPVTWLEYGYEFFTQKADD